MSFIAPGIYSLDDELPYEKESSYYLEFQITSALISIQKLSAFSDSAFHNKYQYFHYYADHLLYSIRQISNRFVSGNSEENINKKRIAANRRNFEFTDDKYPLLSSKQAGNTIEHIDEHNQKKIKSHNGVGGFNLIDTDTDSNLVHTLLNSRKIHPYILDLVNNKILITRGETEINIDLTDLKNELSMLYDRVIYVIDTISHPL